MGIDESISYFQTKIGNYDKQFWEKSIEQRILRGLETRPKKESTLNTNLLDVDLIRGTAFVKAKPKHDWTAVVWRGMKTTAFATIHWDYWRRHTSPRMAAYIIFHFVLQLLQAVCFLLVDPKNAKVTESDVFVPLAMGLCLGILHAQITSHTPHQYSGTSGVKSVPPQTATPVSDFAAEAPTSATISTQFSAPKAANSSPQLRQMKDCVSVKSSKRPRRKLRNSPPPSPVSDDGANNSDVFDNADHTSSEEEDEEDVNQALDQSNTHNQGYKLSISVPVDGDYCSAISDELAHRRRAYSLKVPHHFTGEASGGGGGASLPLRAPSSGAEHDADVESDQEDNEACRQRYLRKRSASLSPDFCFKLSQAASATTPLEEDIKRFKEAKMRGIPDPEVFAKYRSKQLKTNVGGGGQQLSPRLKNTSKWMSHLPDMLEAGAMTIEAEEEKEEEEDDDDDGGGDESEDEEPHNLAEGEATFIPHDLNSNSNDKSKARSHERPDSSKNGIRTSGVSTMLSNEGDNGISGLKTEELEKQKSSAEDEEFEATDTFNTRRRQRAKFLRLFWERACSHRHQQRPPLQAPHVSTAVEETLRQQPISCQPGVSGHWSPDGGSLTETSRNLHLAVGSTTTSKKPVTQFRSGSNASQKRAAAQVARAKVISFRPTAATTTTTTAACADPMYNLYWRAHAASETECDRMNSDLGSEYDSSSVSDEERLGSRGHLDQLPAAAAASATTQPSSASEMPATTSSTRHAIHHHHHPTFALHVRTVGLDDAVGSSVSPTNLPDVSPKHGGGGAGGVGGGGGVSGDLVDEDAEDPFALWYMRAFQGISDPSSGPLETVWCYIWEGRKLKKVNLTLLDIGWSIIQAVERQTVSLFYPKLSCVLALQMALLPLVFHAWYSQSPEGAHTTPSVPLGPWFETDLVRSRRDNHSRNPLDTPGVLALSLYYWISDLVTKVFFASPEYLNNLVGQNMWFRGISLDRLVIGLGIWLRLNIYGVVFFLLCVAERSFQQRLLYAKHFFALTSSHRARKCRIPHFRLNKVAHVKCWLTLRSYLKKQGPQRSIECIITAAFYLAFAFGLFFCAQFLMGKPSRRSGVFSSLATWDILAYTASVSVFLLRFLTLGTKITKKYRNVSVLITEQMNLYLSMEKKPHKKEEFSITNQVLRLAENLLKEVDGPYRICGWAVNPLVYNVFKLVLLSCFSAFISEFLGFKLKLYKLKLNPANW